MHCSVIIVFSATQHSEYKTALNFFSGKLATDLRLPAYCSAIAYANAVLQQRYRTNNGEFNKQSKRLEGLGIAEAIPFEWPPSASYAKRDAISKNPI